MATEAVHEQMLRFLDGETSDAEERALAAAIAQDPEAKRLFATLIRFSGNLSTALVEVESQDATERAAGAPARARRARAITRGIALAAGLLVAAGAGALLGRSPRGPRAPNTAAPLAATEGVGRTDPRTSSEPAGAERHAAAAGAAASPVATLSSVKAKVFLVADGVRRPAHAGATLASGSGVLTSGPTSGGSLTLVDGTIVDIAGNTVLVPVVRAATSTRLFLAQGRVNVRVAPQTRGSQLVLSTPHAEVIATELARLALSALPKEDATRLAIDEGRVRFVDAASGKPVDLGAGKFVVAGEGLRPVVEDEPPPGGILLVVGGSPEGRLMSRSDRLVRAHLQNHGLPVRVAADRWLKNLASSLQTYALIVISSSVQAEMEGLDTWLRDVTVPIVTWEAFLFQPLGMTGAVKTAESGFLDGASEVLIKDGAHPIAAGLAGKVQVSTAPRLMAWGTPSPAASWIATAPGDPTKASIFAYEKGATMIDGTAPARRVGLFLSEGTGETLTSDGWALVDTAIKWALGR